MGQIYFEPTVVEADLFTELDAPSIPDPGNQETILSDVNDSHFRVGLAAVVCKSRVTSAKFHIDVRVLINPLEVLIVPTI